MKKMKPIKIKEPPQEIEVEPEEEEEQDTQNLPDVLDRISQIERTLQKQTSILQIGDILISTKGSLDECQKIAGNLLKDNKIKSYLSFFTKKKFIIPTGIG